jgi:hypothetical protein
MVHGIQVGKLGLTSTNNKTIIEGIQLENHLIIEDIQVQRIFWLNPKAAETKNHTTAVLDFTHPEQANKAIEQGIIIGAKRHDCELYDRACQLKQCFVCHKYGHIGSRCGASQLCGFCAGSHKTQDCSSKGAAPGAPPKCAVCAGAHSAWSRTCEARVKEYNRIDFVKQTHPRLHPERPPPLGPTTIFPTNIPGPVVIAPGSLSIAPASSPIAPVPIVKKTLIAKRPTRELSPADQLLDELSAAGYLQSEPPTQLILPQKNQLSPIESDWVTPIRKSGRKRKAPEHASDITAATKVVKSNQGIPKARTPLAEQDPNAQPPQLLITNGNLLC